MRPKEPKRARASRSEGRRDVVVTVAVVAVLVTLGALVHVFDLLGEGMARSPALGGFVVAMVLLGFGAAAVAVRRWRQVERERALRVEAEARYRALVEESPAVVYTWDPATHRHLYVSGHVEAITGFSPDEWGDGEAWLHAIVEEDREAVRAASVLADETHEPFTAEYRVNTKDGRTIWVRDHAHYVTGPDARPIARGVIVDITPEREAEARAHEAEERFRTIVERVPAVSYIWDASDRPGEAPAGYISPQIRSLLGYESDRWLADPRSWERVVHPEDLQDVLRTWDDAARTGASFSAEYRIRRADGRWVWLRDEAVPVATGSRGGPIYQGVMLDITERRNAEELVRRSEERWRTLLERLPVTAYMVDYQRSTGRIHDRWVAPTIVALLGYEADAWLEEPRTWDRAVHPDDLERVLAAWHEAERRSGTYETEYRMVRRDGVVVWIHEETAVTVDGDRVRADGVFVDVTARRTAEQARDEAQTRFQTLVEQLPAITYIEDAATEETVYISPQIEAMYGIPAEEWRRDARQWEEHLHPDDRDRIVAANGADTGDEWSVDYRTIGKDGRVLWVHNETRLVRADDGAPKYWMGVLSDITERKQAEEALRAAEERLRALVEQIPVAVYTDAADDLSTAIYISPRYEDLSGYTTEERLADPGLWARILHPDDRDAVMAESHRTNETGDPFDVEYRIIRADGTIVWLHDHAVLVARPDGTSVWQGVLQDVTERRLAEEALSRRDAILGATAFAAERLVGADHWGSAASEILDRLAVAAGARRAVLYRNRIDERGDFGCVLVAAAEADGPLARDRSAPQAFRWNDGLSRWALELGAGRTLQARIGDLPADERSSFEGRDDAAGAVVAVPIFVNGEWWGHLVFDHAEEEHAWHDAEVEALSVTAGTIGVAIARERTSSRLAETEARLRTLIEEMPAITYIESPDRTIIFCSPQIEQVLGYRPDEWSEAVWLEAVHPDDRARVVAEDERTYRTLDPFRVEYRLRARDGRVIWVRDESHPVFDERGGLLYWQGVQFDVTPEHDAQERLREAEERYRLLVERTPAVTYVDEEDPAHPVGWPSVYISPQLEQLVGLTPPDWIAEPDVWNRMIHPDDLPRTNDANRRHYATGEPLDVEFRFVLADGTVKWVRDQAVMVDAADGRPRRSHGILMDVTERKLAELALDEAERRYRSLIETLPAVTYRDSLGDGWSTMYVSPQVEDVFGYPAERWLGSDSVWWDALHEDDRERALAAVEQHNRGVPLDVEYRLRHADGHWLWVHDQATVVRDDDGTPLYAQGVLSDVTQRRQAEERLRQAEERYRAIVEHVPAAIYLDEADRSMTSVYVSPQIETITGITQDEWLGDPEAWLRRMHPDDRDEILGGYLAAAEAGRAWTAEYRLQTTDGRIIWVHDETTFVHDADGRPTFLQGVIFDVTERKLAEQALRESELREREAADRLRALDEMKNTFLAAVSHELRSPLTTILGLSLTLERAPDIDEGDRRDLLERLAANARKLDRLLKDLLDIDRLNRGIVEPQYRLTDVGALARRTVESLDLLAGRHVVVRAESAMLGVDPPKVERIVENLVMNAARHTEPDRTIWVVVEPNPDGVTITVEDDGPGVPDALRAAIFEPFRQGPTASPHSPGTGIGLSLVARFTELHGGTAWVDDRDGGGAAFHVFLPDRRPERDDDRNGRTTTIRAEVG